AGMDDEIRRLDEGLETGQAQLGELHGDSLSATRRRLLGQRVKLLAQLVERGGTRLELAVDDQARRGVDVELLIALDALRQDVVAQRLVAEAFVELLGRHAAQPGNLPQ